MIFVNKQTQRPLFFSLLDRIIYKLQSYFECISEYWIAETFEKRTFTCPVPCIWITENGYLDQTRQVSNSNVTVIQIPTARWIRQIIKQVIKREQIQQKTGKKHKRKTRISNNNSLFKNPAKTHIKPSSNNLWPQTRT